MVNNITSNITQLRPVGDADLSRSGKAQPGGGTTTAVAHPSTDDVRLSVAPRTLPMEMQKGPPVDQGLVDRLSGEIASGRYPLDPARIADALFSQAAILAE